MPAIRSLDNRSNPPIVEIEEWDEIGHSYGAEDRRACLLSTVIVCGTWLHLEAIEVKVENDLQVAADERLEDRLYEVNSATDPGYWSTTDIGGRTYVLFAVPFQD